VRRLPWVLGALVLALVAVAPAAWAAPGVCAGHEAPSGPPAREEAGPVVAPVPVPAEPVGGEALGTCGDAVPAGAPPPPPVRATGWVVADLDTGAVLAARPARPPAAGVDAQDPDDARGPRTAGPRRRRRRRAGGRAGRRQPRRDRARRQLHGPAAPFRASAEFRQRHRERPGPHPRRRPGSARGDAGQGVHTGRARHPSRLRVRARRAGDVDVRVRPGRPVPGRAAGPDHPRAGRDEERAVPRGDGATSTRTTGERDSRHRKRRLARLERATRGAEIPTREGKTRARLSGGEGGGAVSGGG
jgi:hypothetical protein